MTYKYFEGFKSVACMKCVKGITSRPALFFVLFCIFLLKTVLIQDNLKRLKHLSMFQKYFKIVDNMSFEFKIIRL